jgi:hypothetical protein
MATESERARYIQSFCTGSPVYKVEVMVVTVAATVVFVL